MVVLKKNFENEFPHEVDYLPKNYNFEINKTLRTIKKYNAKKITLQFPDGLLKYSLAIIDTINKYFDCECIILNDVVYGGCCIDDKNIDSDLVIHYGHSCIVPITAMDTKVLYIFVDVKIDVSHLYNLIIKTFSSDVAVIGTIQFNSSINKLKRMLTNNSREDFTPQIKPLSKGEVLGCTSPIINNVSDVISVGDGRFHLESAMIQNPGLNFYKYCPFTKKLTKEYYDYNKMVEIRKNEIQRAFQGKNFGIILGTLGKQGNSQILKNIKEKLKMYKLYVLMLEEISEESLGRYKFIDSFIQISCPRLSIDWGSGFKRPILSPFEVFYQGGQYMMDFYSSEGHAPWKNYNNRVE